MLVIKKKLFEFTDQLVFKGGTSLSKVYKVIDRYSEDIDITIDYTKFIDPISLTDLSKTKLRNISDKLKQSLANYLNDEVVIFLNKAYQAEFNGSTGYFEVEGNEVINFVYDSIFTKSEYVLNWIKIEFGARNTTDPSEVTTINSYLDDVFGVSSNIKVRVLSPIRTFWEKATLIHVECHRGRLSDSPDRLARHWYDLHKLYNSDLCADALSAKDVLKDVLLVKKAFYNSSYANYDDCDNGKFRLIPEEAGLSGLKADYQKMTDSGFFFKAPPSFDEMINSLSKLELQINLM